MSDTAKEFLSRHFEAIDMSSQETKGRRIVVEMDPQTQTYLLSLMEAHTREKVAELKAKTHDLVEKLNDKLSNVVTEAATGIYRECGCPAVPRSTRQHGGRTYGQIARDEDPEAFERVKRQFQHYDRESLLECELAAQKAGKMHHDMICDFVDLLKKKAPLIPCPSHKEVCVSSGRDCWTTAYVCFTCGSVRQVIEEDLMGQ